MDATDNTDSPAYLQTAGLMLSYFSRDLENLSPNLSPSRREALNSPPSLPGKGAGGLGLALIFPHGVA
jgi:hypothetical protein